MNNKTITTFFLLLFCFYGQATAQFTTSVVGGLNISTNRFFETPIKSNQIAQGYFIGFVPKLPIGKNFQFTMDFQYSQKGYRNEAPVQPMASTAGLVTAPAHFRYSYVDFTPEIGTRLFRHWNFAAGFNISILGKAEQKIDGDQWEKSNFGSGDVDFGWTAKITGSYNQLLYFIRFNQGFTVVQSPFVQLINDVNIVNRNLQLGIGYNFEL